VSRHIDKLESSHTPIFFATEMGFTLVSAIVMLSILTFASCCFIHSQKSHRPVASCWFYQLAASCQQVATGLLVSSGGDRLAGTGCWQQSRSDLLKQPATNLLLTRDNRSDRTTCSKSVEINRFVTTCSNRPCRELFLSSLQQACYQTCDKPVHNKQFLSCHNKFQQACCWETNRKCE
jgi:hypothetical protein